jgi:hypothetical protein
MLTKKLMAVSAGLVLLGFVVSARAEDKGDKGDNDKARQEVIKAINALSTRISALESEVATVKKAVDGLPTTRQLAAVQAVVDTLPTRTDLKGVAQNWDKVLAADDSATRDNCNSSRFTCIFPSDAFPDGAAVRDNATGLVWQRSPSTGTSDWGTARFTCAGPLGDIAAVGGGWRMPTLTEMSSLVDTSASAPALPPGHPFLNVASTGNYWTASTDGLAPANAWIVFMASGQSSITSKSLTGLHVWCVRTPELVFAY